MDIERKLATIEKIVDIQSIDNADNIEKAQIRGWWVVVQKNTYKIGDACVYFEIDSLLPIDNPAFDGLEKYNSIKSVTLDGVIYTGYRIKTVKLRGQISQGMILPLTACFNIDGNSEIFVQGDDVTDVLGVVKYEAQESGSGTQGVCRSTFPMFIPKTGEERVQNIPIYKLANKTFKMTEKLDGTSFTAYKKDGFFGVCSRNQDLVRDDTSIYWRMAYKYNLENIMQENTALQGEAVGPGIQKNRLGLKENQLRVFSVFDINMQKHLDSTDCYLDTLQLVPNMGTITFDENQFKSTDDIVKFVDGLKSALNPKVNAEGIVFVSLETGEKFSFKAINNKYLLGEKD